MTEAGLPGRNDVTVADLRAMVKAQDGTDAHTLADWQVSLLLAEIDRLQERNAKLEAVVEAIRAADVGRDPRHRVSMLSNDWQVIAAALGALDD